MGWRRPEGREYEGEGKKGENMREKREKQKPILFLEICSDRSRFIYKEFYPGS